ncbi:MAG: low molecular weight phosphotyrosine protein phosphatase [Oleiphilaceae bacterium]|nr:low molecular weight phosphotyrosine protein phosphatase [Oleiphilaceae bacterium]
MVSVLFVCLGNICRSPSAHGVFQQVLEKAGAADRVRVDSCGTGDFHIGKAPDQRAIAAARKRNIDIDSLRARQFEPADLKQFDYILVMDRHNLENIRDIWHRYGGTQPELFLGYGQSHDVDEVPDPYYGGEQGFERVLDLIEDASQGLLRDIRERHF